MIIIKTGILYFIQITCRHTDDFLHINGYPASYYIIATRLLSTLLKQKKMQCIAVVAALDNHREYLAVRITAHEIAPHRQQVCNDK